MPNERTSEHTNNETRCKIIHRTCNKNKHKHIQRKKSKKLFKHTHTHANASTHIYYPLTDITHTITSAGTCKQALALKQILAVSV